MQSLASLSRRAFDWVRSVAVDADGGLAWLEAGELFDDLYSGAAGVLFACAEATASGLDTSDVSAGALARLLHLTAGGPDAATMPDDGLFSGWAGLAVALRAWSDVAADDDAAAAAALVTSRIARRVVDSQPDPARYTDVISGDAGVLLVLLGDTSEPARTAANMLADRLVEIAESGPDGPQWRMVADYPILMPGFSHGTAGVAYALALAGVRLDRPDLIAVATQGGDTLLALGHTSDGWALPLSIPRQAHRPPVNYGWCHGPTGTVRLFVTLDAIDPHPRWRAAVDACVQALADSGLPARRYPGFWDNGARCCGTAGVGTMLLDRYRATGEVAFREWADRLADDVISHAVTTENGITWTNIEHTVNPPELPPEPGFMQGTAGIAGWLARLAGAHEDGDAVNPVGLEPPWV